MFEIYYFNEESKKNVTIQAKDIEIFDLNDKEIQFKLHFKINVKTKGVLHFGIRESFDLSTVYTGNANETRFITFKAGVRFESYQLDA